MYREYREKMMKVDIEFRNKILERERIERKRERKKVDIEFRKKMLERERIERKRERKKNHKPPDEAEDYHLLWHLLFPDKEFPSGRK